MGWVPVAYNPFKYRKFVRRTDGAEIDYADAVVLGQGAWAHLEDTLGYAVERTTKKETKA